MVSQQQPVSTPRSYLEFYNACAEQSSYFKPLKATVPKVEKWTLGPDLILGNVSSAYDGYSVIIPTTFPDGTPKRVTIFIVAPPGRGKTKLIKNLIVQLKQMGYAVVILCDPRAEMKVMMDEYPPYSPYWPKGFDPKKIKIRVKTYLPKYCLDTGESIRPDSPLYGAQIITVNMADLIAEDLCTLLKYTEYTDKSTDNARNALYFAWDFFEKCYPIDFVRDWNNPSDVQHYIAQKKQRTLDHFLECIQRMPINRERGGDLNADPDIATVKVLFRDVIRLGRQNLIGDSNYDLIQDLIDGWIPVLSNMHSHLPYFDSAIATVFSRPIYDDRQNFQRRTPRIPMRVCYVPDELQRVGFGGSTFARFIEKDVIRSGRTAVQDFIGSTQLIVPTHSVSEKEDRTEVAREIVSECEYIICFSGISANDIEFLCEERFIKRDEIQSTFETLDAAHTFNEFQSPAVLLHKGWDPQIFYPLPIMAGHTFEQPRN